MYWKGCEKKLTGGNLGGKKNIAADVLMHCQKVRDELK